MSNQFHHNRALAYFYNLIVQGNSLTFIPSSRGRLILLYFFLVLAGVLTTIIFMLSILPRNNYMLLDFKPRRGAERGIFIMPFTWVIVLFPYLLIMVMF